MKLSILFDNVLVYCQSWTESVLASKSKCGSPPRLRFYIPLCWNNGVSVRKSGQPWHPLAAAVEVLSLDASSCFVWLRNVYANEVRLERHLVALFAASGSRGAIENPAEASQDWRLKMVVVSTPFPLTFNLNLASGFHCKCCCVFFPFAFHKGCEVVKWLIDSQN